MKHLNADRTPVHDSYSIRRRSNRALLNLSKPPEQELLPKNQIATSGDWVNEAWRGVISAYTGCRELTMPSDKLPALSGIVSLFQTKTNDQHMAGLWKGDLLHGLLWRLGDYTGIGSLNWRRFPARAPSWSWASWDGLITFPFNAMKQVQDDYNAILIGAEVQTKGLNPYGEVSKGCLKLKCWTRTMTFKEITETIGLPALDQPRPTWPQNANRQFESQESCLQDDHVYTVVCVGTFQFGSPSNIPKGYLLLDPAPVGSVDGYRRVGMAPHVSWNHLDNFDPRHWKQADLAIV